MKKLIKSLLFKIPPVKHLREELKKYKTYHPPGHYYSPVPDKDYVKKNSKRIFDRSKKELPGINLREKEQFQLLETFRTFYKDIYFTDEKTAANRYYYKNGLFSYSDAIFLHSMMRHFSPKRIIEAGSGYSSAVMLDTNEKTFNNSIDILLIEPYPVNLNKLTEGFPKQFRMLPNFVQDIPLDTFRTLEKNDILFIDSTHVSKAGSDVNYILFEILPVLKEGVIIHFHDVFYPFEYPEAWIEKGFAWNEDYMLRSFLMYNDHFEIIFFNTFMEQFYEKWITENMPDVLKNRGGGLWLRKVKG